MAFTFSRRDFMKYTALAAAAVAVSGSLTGCANPNQPSDVYNGSDVSLSFGGSSTIFGIGGPSDKHTLKVSAEVDGETKKTKYEGTTLTCVFQHYPVSEGTSCNTVNYQLRIVKNDGTIQYVNANKEGVIFKASNASGTLKKNETVTNVLTISNLTISDAKQVFVQYFPRHNALGQENDAYSDVYATWEITSLFA